MIKETFIALKAIGVSDAHILDVIAAFEAREERYRTDMHEMKRDIVVLKWAMAVWPTILFGLLVTLLFKVFTK